MLSILIPVFNFDVRDLVRNLHRQCLSENIPFEIVLIDDHSMLNFVMLNRELNSMEHVSLTELPENTGRSSIRNLLASKARYPYLVFLDCDSSLQSSEFIRNYVKNLRDKVVLYGGRSYEENPPSDRKLYLRWLYGVKREVISADERKRNRYKSFMTNNFVIPADIFNKIKFNETLTGYGHEDTLFGIELKKRNVEIIHIDNPLCHIGLETADEFLSKTSQGIKNLAYLMKMKLSDDNIKVASTYETLRKLHLTGAFLKIFNVAEPSILRNLKSSNPSLRNFDIYKLGLLARELRE